MPVTLRRVLGHLLAVAVLFGACAAVLRFGMQLDRARLDVPFVYRDDSLLMQMLVQNGLEGKWYTWADRLGAPHGQEMSDYPCADTLDFVLVKAIGLFTRDTATVFNLFYLLTYPLVAWSALVALRAMRLSYPAALAGGLLYAFIPYHYMRNEGHLFLTSYFVVPLVVPPMLWLAAGWVPFRRPDPYTGELKPHLLDGKLALSLLACFVMGAGNPYYGFYAMFLFGVAGVSALTRRLNAAGLASFVTGLVLAAVIAGSVAVNMLPTLQYNRQAGPNETARSRNPGEAEVYGLKLAQCLLPAPDHRDPKLREQTDYYYTVSLLDPNENATAALGAVGAVGFMALLVCVLASRRPDFPPVLAGLADLNLGAVLLATVGGLGAVINLYFPQMRTYNRVSVFISFFTLAAVLWLVDRLWQNGRPVSRGLAAACFVALTAFGLWDEVTLQMVPGYDRERRTTKKDYNEDVTTKRNWAHTYDGVRDRWFADAEFVRKAEEQLPPGAMVAQLPLLDFPEPPAANDLPPYRQLYGYLHSKALRWSTGAIKGRPAGEQQRKWAQVDKTVDGKPQEPGPEYRWASLRQGTPDALLDELRKAGFTALLVDWDGYDEDHRADMRKELTARLGDPIAELHRLPDPNKTEAENRSDAETAGPAASFFRLTPGP